MNQPIVALLVSVLVTPSVSSFAAEPPKRRSMADICPMTISAMELEAAGLDDLVIRVPAKPTGISDAARAEAAEQQRQCMEWQRKLAGVPMQSWDKMSDAAKIDAVEKAKAARLKSAPAEK